MTNEHGEEISRADVDSSPEIIRDRSNSDRALSGSPAAPSFDQEYWETSDLLNWNLNISIESENLNEILNVNKINKNVTNGHGEEDDGSGCNGEDVSFSYATGGSDGFGFRFTPEQRISKRKAQKAWQNIRNICKSSADI